MVIWTSLQACGVVLPFAISTSICRSSVTICSGLYLLIDMTGLPPQVNSLSFHLVQKSPVRSMRSDNGPEFVAKELRKWLGNVGTGTLYIEPGSPWENGYCESFNGKLRD